MNKLALPILAAGLACTAPAVTISFDEFGAAPSVFAGANHLTTAYSGMGVTFSGPTSIDGGAVLDQLSSFGVSAHSGNNFLGFNRLFGTTNLDGGRPIDPEQVSFSTMVNSVSIYAAGGDAAAVFVMSAFDSSNNLLGVDVESVLAGTWGQLSFAAPNISYITLSQVGTDPHFVYDDLSYNPVPEPATLAVLGLGAAALLRRRRR